MDRLPLRALAALLAFMTLTCARAGFCADNAGADNAGIVATLAYVEGSVSIGSGGTAAAARSAGEGAPIRLHDVVATGPGSRALVLMIDDSSVTLGADATFSTDDFTFGGENGPDGKARYAFNGGAFQFVGGSMTKTPRPDIALNLPYGAVVVRDATVWAGPAEENYGVFVKEGRASFQNARGRISLAEGQGTLLGGANALPDKPSAWGPERIDLAMGEIAFESAGRAADRIKALQPSNAKKAEAYISTMKKPAPEVNARRHDNPYAPPRPPVGDQSAEILKLPAAPVPTPAPAARTAPSGETPDLSSGKGL